MANNQFSAAAGTEVRNKLTGEIITAEGVQDITNEIGGDQGQFFSQDFELFKEPEINIPGVGNTPKYVDSTDNVTDANTLAAQDADTAINGAEAGAETPGAALARLQEEQKSLGAFTTDELSAIDAAGEQARLAFQPIVEEQEERRRVTLPGDIVRAGEKGGFLNTQQAGVAALLPTDEREGEAFVGAGGALDQKRQTLDRAVALVRAKQLEAVSQAKAAQRKAITSGKRADFDVAISLAQLAQKFKQDQEQLSIQKDRLSLDVAQEQRAGTEQERRFQFDIAKFDIGNERLQRTQDLAIAKFEQEATEDAKVETLDNIKRMAESRIGLDQFSDEKITEMEIKSGLEPGTFEAFYEDLLGDVARGDILDDLDIQQKIATLTRTKQLATGGGGGGGVSTGFSSTEKKKLEQAGLLDASRQEQLNFLFGKTDGDDEFSQAQQFLNDNPNATENELKISLRQNTSLTDGDVNLLIDDREYLSKDYLETRFNEKELFDMAKNAGQASMWTGKEKDVDRFLTWSEERIEEARKQGYTDNEIFKFLNP